MKYWVILGSCIILTVILTVALQSYKKIIISNCLIALRNRDYNLYFQIIDSRYMKIIYSSFSRLYMMLNGAMIQGNNELIEEVLNKVLLGELNNTNAHKIYIYIFYYYLNKDDNERCLNVLKKFEGKINYKLNESLNQLYNVFIKKT